MDPDQQIVEPVRKSVLDVQRENLKAANKVKHDTNTQNVAKQRKLQIIYVHRIIYVGQHSFKDCRIKEVMHKIIDDINLGYCDEKLTGLLLYYDTFFCHMVEVCKYAF